MIGTLLGDRYELQEKIGEGGMAEVYKAKCHKLNRFVAIKILKREFSDDAEFVEKFKREATAVASLSDNNIVGIYDVGTQGNINYIVMEYVKGNTLKEDLRRRGKYDAKDAINIGIQIAKALECAHRNNIIHRDVKPHNILLTENGIVKVTDFGIAKASNSVTITNTNKVMGSAHYFSPEQAKGSFVDERTDIYSLGIVLYELVTGVVPFDAETPVSIALKHIQEAPIPPKQLNPSISEGLNKLILKAIEKEPVKRYQTAVEIISDLEKIQNNFNYNIKTNNMEEDFTRVMDPITPEKLKTYAKKDNDYDDYYDEDDEDIDDEIQTPSKQKFNTKKNSKKKKPLVVLAIIALLAIIGIVGVMAATGKLNGNQGKTSTDEVTVPNIKGLKEADAKNLVEEKGLVFTVESREKSDQPEGTVIRCSPDEGTTVKTNSEVKVVLSAGAKNITVPSVVNMDIDSAKEIIKSNEFAVGNISYEFNEDVPKDSVIRQTPDPNSSAEKGSSIDMVISKGPKNTMVTVPSLVGKSINDIKDILLKMKLRLGGKTSVDTSDKSQDGIVSDQNPSDGIQVNSGTAVSVTYYKYKKPEKQKVEVPNFIGETVEGARELASDSGISVNVSGNDNDTVVSQDIPSGSMVEPKTVVNLRSKPAASGGDSNNQ